MPKITIQGERERVPKESRTFDGKPIPASLAALLESPTQAEGGRHAEMLRVVKQLVGNGCGHGAIAARMKINYPHKSPTDIANAIRGAVDKGATPTVGLTPGTGRAVGMPSAPVTAAKVERRKLRVADDAAEALPDLKLSGVAASIAFLEAVFKPEEIVSITNASAEREDGGLRPDDKGTFWTVEEWVKQIPARTAKGKKAHWLDGEAGAWVRVNPFKPGDETGADIGVADYRHLLVEFDRPDMPIERQWAAVKASGLPIAAVLTSGGKSLHAWVKVEATTLEEFRLRQKEVYGYLGDLKPDPSNINPSRFSRLPGVKRGKKEQKLIALNLVGSPGTELEFAL